MTMRTRTATRTRTASEELTQHASAPARTVKVQRLILRRTWLSLWRHLAMLAISGAATGIGTAAAVWLAGGSRLLTPLLLAGLAGPTLMPLLRVVEDALIRDETTLQSYLQALRGSAVRSATLSLIPALSLTCLAAAAEAYARTSSTFVLPSLAIAIAASVLTVTGGMILMPAAVARPQLRGLRLWGTSWHLLGRWPVRCLAPVIIAALSVAVAMSVTSSLVLLLPAPIALLAGSAYWCCAVELGAQDVTVAKDAPSQAS